ncbi:MAG TPA: hypothetical protein VM008_20705 [Phycisphaerae bacterium]|nr:hypothetical protein [Phycisphaerae bacterium]
MPSKKDGIAGQLQAPVDPTEAIDAQGGQAGEMEEPAGASSDRGTETMTVTSVVAAAEEIAEPDLDHEEEA